MKILSLLVAVLFLAAGALAANAPATSYIVTNDDNAINTATFYSIGPSGELTQAALVPTNGFGISGGFFGMSRVSALHTQTADCVFVSDAGSGDIAGIDVATQQVTGNFLGSANDAGTSNGIGLAMNKQYLYASFSDSNTIGTFKVRAGCKLKFLGDITVGGLRGGVVNGMAVHANMLITTYGDGSIESFDISAGVPVSNGDEQISTASHGGFTYPNGIDITKDGHYAIFGDTATSTVIEVSDISLGKLTTTVAYHLGKIASSSNVRLSPDESLLYISNTQGDRVSAAFFDKTTGVLSKGCHSGQLRGYVHKWSYLGALALQKRNGLGGRVYVAEFGGPSYIGMVDVTSSGGVCTLKEVTGSPFPEANSFGLLSIGSFPPRSF